MSLRKAKYKQYTLKYTWKKDDAKRYREQTATSHIQGSQGERPGAHASLAAFGRAPTQHTFISDLQPPGETIHVCCPHHPSCDTFHSNPRKLIHKISIIYFFKMKFILCLPLLKYKLHNPKAGIFFFFFYFILGY